MNTGASTEDVKEHLLPVEPEIVGTDTDDAKVEEPTETVEPEKVEPAETVEPEEVEPTETVEPELDEEGNPIEPVEFSFDRKLKVMDSEVEIPEYLAKAVQNEEQAEELKELFQKSHGLEPIKQKRDYYKEQSGNFQKQLADTSNQLTEQKNMFNFYNKLINNDDMALFQKYTGITDKQILDHAANIIRQNELTPAERAEYNRNIESRQRQYNTEFTQHVQQNQVDYDAIQAQHNELDQALEQSGVSQQINEFESRNGLGSFKEEVIKRAIYLEEQGFKAGKPVQVTPQEALESTLNYFGISQGQSTIQQQTTEPVQVATQTTQTAPETTVVVKEKPTIPTTRAGGKSPVKKTVKSIDDLRALSQNFEYGN